jgi:hypothetical protein
VDRARTKVSSRFTLFATKPARFRFKAIPNVAGVTYAVTH